MPTTVPAEASLPEFSVTGNSVAPRPAPLLSQAVVGRRVYIQSQLAGGALYTHPIPAIVAAVEADRFALTWPDWENPVWFRRKDAWRGFSFNVRNCDLEKLLTDSGLTSAP